MTAPFLPTRWLIASGDAVDDADIFPFLRGQSFLINKGPRHRTKIDESVSGRERRRPLWSYPIWRFRVAYEYLRDDVANLELQRVLAFYNSKDGSSGAFFYLDRNDNAVAGERFGTGDGVTTTFQLTRSITIGDITFQEPIRGLYGTPTIYKAGVATGAYTTGILGEITFTTAPTLGQALTWDGNFFFLCRFENDDLDVGQIAKGIWQNGALDFRSFKP
jgi:uncharacterized protein (TIGR02217 family)